MVSPQTESYMVNKSKKKIPDLTPLILEGKKRTQITLYKNQVLLPQPETILYDDGEIAGSFSNGINFVITGDKMKGLELEQIKRLKIVDQGGLDLVFVKPLAVGEMTLEECLKELQRHVQKYTNTTTLYNPPYRLRGLENVLKELEDLEQNIEKMPFESHYTILNYDKGKIVKEIRENAQHHIKRYQFVERYLEQFHSRLQFILPTSHAAQFAAMMEKYLSDQERDMYKKFAQEGSLFIYGAILDKQKELFHLAVYREREITLKKKHDAASIKAPGMDFLISICNYKLAPKDFPDVSYLHGYFLQCALDLFRKINKSWVFWRLELNKFKTLLEGYDFHEFIGTASDVKDKFAVYAKQLLMVK